MRWVALALVPLLAGCPMKTPVINGFQGENQVLAESLLPPNVSPDALNCDYRNGTVKKRAGWQGYSRALSGFVRSTGRVKDLVVTAGLNGDVFVLKELSATDYTLYKYRGATDTWSTIGGSTSGVGVGGQLIVVGDYVLAVGTDNFKVNASSGSAIQGLSPGTPNVAGTAAGVSGTGAFTGTRLYKFAFRNSNDGSEGALSDVVTSSAASGHAQFDLTGIPTTAEAQVDKVEIYATELGGTAYYFLAEINEGTTTYTDTTTDAALVGNTPLDEYRGAPPGVTQAAFWWDDRLWFVYEDGLLYTERATGDLSVDGMAVYSRFYADNFLAVDRGVGRVVTAVPLSESHILVFLTNRIMILSGAGPGLFRINDWVEGVGVESRCNVAAGLNHIYFSNYSGVYRIPRAGGGVESVSERILPDGTFGAPYTRPDSVAYSADNRKLYVCVDGDSTPRMFVFDEYVSVWAEWDIEADYVAAVRLPSSSIFSSEETILAMIDGRIARLETDTADGAAFGWLGATTPSSTGTVDSATSTTLTDASATGWATVSNMMAGVKVRVRHASDGSEEERTISSNTSTQLTVSSAWDTTPSAGDEYWIGGIDWRWRTPALDLNGDRSVESISKRLHAWFRNPTANVDVACAHMGGYESVTAPDSPYTLDSGQRKVEVLTNLRADEQTFEFSNPYPDEPVELEAIQIEYQERVTKADTTND